MDKNNVLDSEDKLKYEYKANRFADSSLGSSKLEPPY